MNGQVSFYRGRKLCTFLSPTKIIIGEGSASEIGKEARALGGRKVLIVTDQGVVRSGILDSVLESLRKEKLKTKVFDEVEPEPPARIVDKCAEVVRKEKFNLVIGVGGGSSLDVAKGVSILATNKGVVLDYVGVDTVPKPGLPKILVPTTAGTGSEVTRVFVITDEQENTKKVVYTNFNIANVAILDPLLTLSLPQSVTADTGVDALVHAIEAYVSVNSTPFSDMLALHAISLISENLPKAYAKGSDLEARYNMLLAATVAGLAFTSGGLGAVHGLAYVLGTEYHMSHGRSNAIMLPHVMRYNLIGNYRKYANIAEAMGEVVEGLSIAEQAELSVEAVKKLLTAVGISYKLSDYGIPRSDLPKLVEGGMKQARLFVPNPRDLTEEDVRKIYEGAF